MTMAVTVFVVGARDAVEDRRLDLDSTGVFRVFDEKSTCLFVRRDVSDTILDSHLVVGVAEVVSERRGFAGLKMVKVNDERFDGFEFDDDCDALVVDDVAVTETTVEGDAYLSSRFGRRTYAPASDFTACEGDAFDLIGVRFYVLGVSMVSVTDEHHSTASSEERARQSDAYVPRPMPLVWLSSRRAPTRLRNAQRRPLRLVGG